MGAPSDWECWKRVLWFIKLSDLFPIMYTILNQSFCWYPQQIISVSTMFATTIEIVLSAIVCKMQQLLPRASQISYFCRLQFLFCPSKTSANVILIYYCIQNIDINLLDPLTLLRMPCKVSLISIQIDVIHCRTSHWKVTHVVIAVLVTVFLCCKVYPQIIFLRNLPCCNSISFWFYLGIV